MADIGGTSVYTTTGNLTSLNGLFKKVYGKLEQIIPAWAILQADIPFDESSKTGEEYTDTVVLKLEHGVTRAASNMGAFDLRAPVAGLTAKTVVTGFQHVLRWAIDYETSFAGSGGVRAFQSAMGNRVEAAKTSIHKNVELDLLYGQDLTGLGVVEAWSTVTNANDTATFTAASWAPGIWAGMEGAQVDVWATGLTAKRTGAGAGGTIESVNLDNRSIKFTASVTGTPVATDVVTFPNVATAGPSAWQQMAGIHKILTNTGALFGINATTYNLWKGITFSAGSTDLSLGTILQACARIVAKGADSDINVYVSPLTWANLLNDQAALRRYNAQTSTLENGAQRIQFWGQIGKIAVVPHPFVKEGFAYGISPRLWKRVGATDVTFSRPALAAGTDGNFFRELYDQAGYEFRCYSHQALYTPYPGKAFVINNIVNSTA